mgnify:CR=1 FL=1
MYGYGEIKTCGQTALCDECLALLGDEVAAPIVVEPDLAHGAECQPAGRLGEIPLHRAQLLAPAGVVVYGCGVQPHHGVAHCGLGCGHREEPLMREGVDGGQQKGPDAGVAGALQRLGAVGVELLGIEV